MASSNNPTTSRPQLQPPVSLLNTANLSKALAKPPPLSAVLTLPKNALANSAVSVPNGGLVPSSIGPTASSSQASSNAPSPNLVQQQLHPLVGSNLIAQSKKAAESDLIKPPVKTCSPLFWILVHVV